MKIMNRDYGVELTVVSEQTALGQTLYNTYCSDAFKLGNGHYAVIMVDLKHHDFEAIVTIFGQDFTATYSVWGAGPVNSISYNVDTEHADTYLLSCEDGDIWFTLDTDHEVCSVTCNFVNSVMVVDGGSVEPAGMPAWYTFGPVKALIAYEAGYVSVKVHAVSDSQLLYTDVIELKHFGDVRGVQLHETHVAVCNDLYEVDIPISSTKGEFFQRGVSVAQRIQRGKRK